MCSWKARTRVLNFNQRREHINIYDFTFLGSNKLDFWTTPLLRSLHVTGSGFRLARNPRAVDREKSKPTIFASISC